MYGARVIVYRVVCFIQVRCGRVDAKGGGWVFVLYQDIKGALKAECVTITQLARKRGVSVSYLNNVLNGRGSIRIDIAYEIMDDLHLPPEQIFKYFPPKGARQNQEPGGNPKVGNSKVGNPKGREVIRVGRK